MRYLTRIAALGAVLILKALYILYCASTGERPISTPLCSEILAPISQFLANLPFVRSEEEADLVRVRATKWQLRLYHQPLRSSPIFRVGSCLSTILPEQSLAGRLILNDVLQWLIRVGLFRPAHFILALSYTRRPCYCVGSIDHQVSRQ